MTVDRSLLTGSTTMLILTLLEQKDMYGYEMIEQLRLRSHNVFALKAGTLYPLLHDLEKSGMLKSYDREGRGRMRKYYSLTHEGHGLLQSKKSEWHKFAEAISHVIGGGEHYEQT